MEVNQNVSLLYCTEEPEKLIEQIGRICYDSLHKNPSLEGYKSKKFIQGLIKNGHTSVLEHATATFLFTGVSRALTHQLVRHRIASFTQRSQRYTSERDFEIIIPPKIKRNPIALRAFEECIYGIAQCYEFLQNQNIPNEDARFVLPNACETKIAITANFREWRHIILLRADNHAQWEIRNLAKIVLSYLYDKAPIVFEDVNDKFFEGG
jgi:thymidylate synthase (FAD)